MKHISQNTDQKPRKMFRVPCSMLHDSRGFALVEIMVVVTLVTVGLLAALSVAQQAIKVSRLALNQAQASFLLEEGAEAVKIIRDNNWSNISALANGTTYYLSYSSNTWNLTTTVSTIAPFTRTVVFSAVNRDSNDDITTSGGILDSRTKKVTITTSWASSLGNSTKTLDLYIADIFT